MYKVYMAIQTTFNKMTSLLPTLIFAKFVADKNFFVRR